MPIINDAISDQAGLGLSNPPGAAATTNVSSPAPSLVNGPLITPSIGSTGVPGAQDVAQLGQPQAWGVTSDQTVEGRIRSIIDSNNPIIQMARTKALEGMNARGLLNSSLATGAADAAAYAAATPIATADAATAAKAASYNADESNQFGIKNVEAQNTRANNQLTADTQLQVQRLQADSQMRLKQLDTQTQVQVQQLQADNAKLVQTDSQAATALNQAMVSMTNINMNDKMDANAKTQAIAQIQRDLKSSMRVLSATSGLDLASQLNFAGYDGFDASGNFIGFNAAGQTVPAPAPVDQPAVAGPAAAAAPPAPAPVIANNNSGWSWSPDGYSGGA